MKRLMFGMLVAVTASCGGGGGGGSTAKFIGTWSFTSGTSTLTCAGTPYTSQMTGTVTVQEGTTSDLVINQESCVLHYSVTGSTAMLVPGQSCVQVFDTDSVTVAYSADNVQTSDGVTATEAGSGTATLVINGQTLTCTYSSTATLTKVGK